MEANVGAALSVVRFNTKPLSLSLSLLILVSVNRSIKSVSNKVARERVDMRVAALEATLCLPPFAQYAGTPLLPLSTLVDFASRFP